MTEFGGYKVHPSLARLPMMNERQLARLAASIKQIGLIEPIVPATRSTASD
jgi:ParB-like chromosome segregation protein Spo0J